jgi:hypothetical protein
MGDCIYDEKNLVVILSITLEKVRGPVAGSLLKK